MKHISDEQLEDEISKSLRDGERYANALIIILSVAVVLSIIMGVILIHR